MVELLVAMSVLGMVLALASPLLFSSRAMVQSDQLRTAVNQSVRSGSDLIGADIRMAGERFPQSSGLQLSPIELIPGTSGAPDELVLRRNLWEGTLPVCEALTLGSTTAPITVVRDSLWLAGPPGEDYPECGQPVGTDDWPENLGTLRTLADSIGQAGVLSGYIFDPASSVGEFISFEIPADAWDTGLIQRTVTTPLLHAYPLENRARIYLLEERRYRVNGDIIELIVNEDYDNALRTTADVQGMRVRFVLQDGTAVSALPTGSTWRDIRSVELTLAASSTRGTEQVRRELTSRYFPRNILSR